MNVIEYRSARIPIAVQLSLSGAGVTGLTESDILFKFSDASGGVATLGSGDYTLVEVDAAEFPGLYLVTEYPIVDTGGTYLTKFAGQIRLKWSDVTPGTFDDGELDLRVGQELAQVREVHRAAFQRIEWNGDEARWDLYDESDVLFGWFDARDANGGEPAIEGQAPVTRLAFTSNPSYVPV